jgi:hypothetical protein
MRPPLGTDNRAGSSRRRIPGLKRCFYAAVFGDGSVQIAAEGRVGPELG